MYIKLIILGFLICSSNLVAADTIWCKMFKAGCITEEQKQKQAQNCEQMGNQSYVEAMNEAQANPAIWQNAGMDSAQDYARMRKRSMVSTCLKMSSPKNY